MRVIYGNEVNTEVDDGVSPEEIIAVLKENYAELSRAEYTTAEEGGVTVMRITVKSGSKA